MFSYGDEDWKEDDFFSSCGSLAWSHITQSSLSTANKPSSVEMELMILRNISAAFPNSTTILNDGNGSMSLTMALISQRELLVTESKLVLNMKLNADR